MWDNVGFTIIYVNWLFSLEGTLKFWHSHRNSWYIGRYLHRGKMARTDVDTDGWSVPLFHKISTNACYSSYMQSSGHSNNAAHPGQASKQAPPAKHTIPPPRRQTRGRRAGISTGWDLEHLLCSSQTMGKNRVWAEPSQLGQSESGPEELLNWTEWMHLASVLRTELQFPDKLLTRERNYTELMLNQFQLWMNGNAL